MMKPSFGSEQSSSGRVLRLGMAAWPQPSKRRANSIATPVLSSSVVGFAFRVDENDPRGAIIALRRLPTAFWILLAS